MRRTSEEGLSGVAVGGAPKRESMSRTVTECVRDDSFSSCEGREGGRGGGR